MYLFKPKYIANFPVTDCVVVDCPSNVNLRTKEQDIDAVKYYPEIELITINPKYSGLIASDVKETGSVGVAVYPLSQCFLHFVTDGMYWNDTVVKNNRQPVLNGCFALL